MCPTADRWIAAAALIRGSYQKCVVLGPVGLLMNAFSCGTNPAAGLADMTVSCEEAEMSLKAYQVPSTTPLCGTLDLSAASFDAAL